jgi:hypothetical protein
MALHRDIYWVGRQWAVTGYGLQACDQKQKGKFDIEAARLWEDDALEAVRAQKWLNVEDFDKALAVARKRHPEPPRKTAPPETPVVPLKDEALVVPPKPEPPKPVVPEFHLRIERVSAKFLPHWRIRVRR